MKLRTYRSFVIRISLRIWVHITTPDAGDPERSAAAAARERVLVEGEVRLDHRRDGEALGARTPALLEAPTERRVGREPADRVADRAAVARRHEQRVVAVLDDLARAADVGGDE